MEPAMTEGCGRIGRPGSLDGAGRLVKYRFQVFAMHPGVSEFAATATYRQKILFFTFE
jgi:hypothetical protein